MVKTKKKPQAKKEKPKQEEVKEETEDESRKESVSKISIDVRASIDNADEIQREQLEDAKDTLVEALEFLNVAIQNVNKLKVSDDQSGEIKTIGDLLSDSNSKLSKCSRYIDKVQSLKKLEIKKMEQSQHKINTLELELRKQGDIAYLLQGENEALSKLAIGFFN